MTVLDASALLALIHGEPGHQIVAEAIDGAVIGAVNLAEVVGKLVDSGVDVSRLRQLLSAAGVVVEPLTAVDAELAGALRGLDGGRSLSLGDRCCLALATRVPPSAVLTADHAWVALKLPIEVRLIR
ncbi:MAG: type II toxin-antitoxin system VapC family toxin [Angustibacter sp.]